MWKLLFRHYHFYLVPEVPNQAVLTSYYSGKLFYLVLLLDYLVKEKTGFQDDYKVKLQQIQICNS